MLIAVAVGLLASVAVVLWMQSCEAKDEPLRGEYYGLTFPQSNLPKHDVAIGDLPLHVEVASGEGEIIIGMMGRREVPDGTGMLFVFPDAGIEPRKFWMKNCPTDLDVAFFGADRKLLNWCTMKALDVHSRHKSNGLARFAVEVRGGFFNERGVKVGDELHLPKALLKQIDADDD